MKIEVKDSFGAIHIFEVEKLNYSANELMLYEKPQTGGTSICARFISPSYWNEIKP